MNEPVATVVVIAFCLYVVWTWVRIPLRNRKHRSGASRQWRRDSWWKDDGKS